MIRKIYSYISTVPIKRKIVLWSSCMLILLFVAYNFAQYVVINQWMINREKVSIQKSMGELQDFFKEKKGELNAQSIINSTSFIEKVNEQNQLIRILDAEGKPIVTVTDELSADVVGPQASDRPLLISVWHYEDHLLVMRSPLVSGAFQGTIEIVNNLETFDQWSNAIFWVMIIAGLGAVLLSGIGGFLLARQLLRPIQSLADAIRNVKKKGLHERVPHSGANDELSQLAILFNDLMSQLETSFIQQKQFVEDASHELRTPVSIIKGHLSLLHRWGKDDPQILEKSLAVTLQEFDRLEGIVHELLALTRAEQNEPSDLQYENILPVELIRQTVTRFGVLHPEIIFDLDVTSLHSSAMIRAVPHQLEQIILILLDNAVKYSVAEQEIRIVGKMRDHDLIIEVIDKGIGIPAEDLPYVFDRFYRVDKARSREKGGTGLGLAIAKTLVGKNGGEISIASVEQAGTRVTLKFPVIQPCFA